MMTVDQFCCRFSSVSPVEVMWKYLKDHLIQIQDDCIPSKLTSSKYHQPWINTRIKRLIRRKRKWYRRYRQTRSHTAKQVYESLKKESRQACKTALNDYLNNIFSEDKGNKQFWSYIKSRRKETVGIASLCNENGITVTSSQEKANI